MSTFIGSIEAKLDIKGRVAFPATYRKLLPEEAKESLIARIDPDHDCLILYPQSVWDKKVTEFAEQLNEWDADDQLLLTQFTSSAERLDLDAHGRILLPKRLQQAIGITTEALFIGVLDRIAVWNAATYNATKLSKADFAQRIKEKMANCKL